MDTSDGQLGAVWADWLRRTGFRGGAGAPAMFRNIGGPLTGTLLHAGTLAGMGWLGGKAYERLSGRRHTRLPAALAVLMGGAGVAPHGLALWAQQRLARHVPWRQPANWPRAVLQRLWVMNADADKLRRVAGGAGWRGQAAQSALSGEGLLKGSAAPDPYGVAGGMGSYSTFLPEGQSYGIPTYYTESEIARDPHLSPIAKALALGYIDDSSAGGMRPLVTWPTVSRAVVGAGVGGTGAVAFGKVLDVVFGGMSPRSQRRLRNAGIVAGMLMNTGALGRK